ncbi:MAG: DUF1376 domain-containing protein [Rickettsiales bacterium]|nr:DUF1376 domain-containing protein [Rickettsiales bacterium]
MSDLSFMPFYVADYLADTMHLSIDEHGAYLKLMFCMWRTDDGWLPDDDKKICTMLSIGAKKWASIKPVIAPFFTYEEGHFTQGRLSRERKKVEGKIKSCSDSGKKSAEAKALKNKDTTSTDVDVSLQRTSNIARRTSYPEPDIDKKDKSSLSSPLTPKFILPDWIKPEPWNVFIESRKKLKAVNSEFALRCIVADLERFRDMGHDPNELIETAIKHGWKSVYEPKNFGAPRHAQSSNHHGFLEEGERLIREYRDQAERDGQAASDSRTLTDLCAAEEIWPDSPRA